MYITTRGVVWLGSFRNSLVVQLYGRSYYCYYTRAEEVSSLSNVHSYYAVGRKRSCYAEPRVR